MRIQSLPDSEECSLRYPSLYLMALPLHSSIGGRLLEAILDILNRRAF